jgi:hypothetical protein
MVSALKHNGRIIKVGAAGNYQPKDLPCECLYVFGPGVRCFHDVKEEEGKVLPSLSFGMYPIPKYQGLQQRLLKRHMCFLSIVELVCLDSIMPKANDALNGLSHIG